MTRNLKQESADRIDARRFVGATSSQACCHRRRGCQSTQSYCQSGYGYGSPTGYYSSGQGGYVTHRRRLLLAAERPAIPVGTATASPVRYDFGRPGYNPGGIGGPASGLGVRPGLGVGGFGPGR